MTLISIIYNNPTTFHKILDAYTIDEARRGVIFAAIIGYDVTKAMDGLFKGDTAYDKYLQVVLECRANSTRLPSWVPAYTYGYETEVSSILVGHNNNDTSLPYELRLPNCRESFIDACGIEQPIIDPMHRDAMVDAMAAGPPYDFGVRSRILARWEVNKDASYTHNLAAGLLARSPGVRSGKILMMPTMRHVSTSPGLCRVSLPTDMMVICHE
jgi:hypothetical protein